MKKPLAPGIFLWTPTGSMWPSAPLCRLERPHTLWGSDANADSSIPLHPDHQSRCASTWLRYSVVTGLLQGGLSSPTTCHQWIDRDLKRLTSHQQGPVPLYGDIILTGRAKDSIPTALDKMVQFLSEQGWKINPIMNLGPVTQPKFLETVMV